MMSGLLVAASDSMPAASALLPRPAHAYHSSLCPDLQVRSGKDAMPPFQGSLSDDEIAAVAAFVYNQAAKDLWASS